MHQQVAEIPFCLLLTSLHFSSELRSRVNLVGFWVSFAWGRVWMSGHGVVASYRLHGTQPWLSVVGTGFGVLFFAMNIGGGVLVWMREAAELQAQPQRTPFWMLENRDSFDDPVVPRHDGSAGQLPEVERVRRQRVGKRRGRAGTTPRGGQTIPRHRASRSPSLTASPRRIAS